jgi:superfamily I DNA/RNA helicase
MKDVIFHKDTEFQKQLVLLRNSGGQAAQAYTKVLKVRSDLELGQQVSVPGTNNGESRIKNCFKYDLGNGYRLVTIDAGAVVMFCFAGKHDDADKWLDRNRGLSIVKNKDRSIKVIHAEGRDGPLPSPEQPEEFAIPLYKMVENIDWELIFPTRLLREAFQRITIHSSQEEKERFLEDAEQFLGTEKADLMPELIIACQNRNAETVNTIRALLVGEATIVQESSEGLSGEDVRDEVNSESVVVLSDLTDEEIERLWDPTQFQEWMVYLHPGQKRIVKEEYPKPAILRGVSGSGKTCVLIHRARALAKKYPDEKILILTLNRSLNRLLLNLLHRLNGGPLGNVHAESFHDYVSRMLFVVGMEEFFTDIGIVYGIDRELQNFLRTTDKTRLKSFFDYRSSAEIKRLWNQFKEDRTSGANLYLRRTTNYLVDREETLDAEDYLIEELDLIRSAFSFTGDYKEYQEYDRPSRSINLPKNHERRADILDILKGWDKYQYRRASLDPMTISQAALWAIEQEDRIPSSLQYRCVLVDEFQDFSTRELQLISMIPTNPENGLFLTGDSGQKIYAKDFHLPSAGLGPRERVDQAIRKNYRNSRQILEAANLLLTAYTGDKTAKDEGVTVLSPEYAVRSTAKPFALKTNDQIQAGWQKACEWIEQGCPSYAVAIVSANEKQFPVKDIMGSCPDGAKVKELTGDYEIDSDAIIVSDINTVKGFEFSLVIIIGLNEDTFPVPGKARGELWRDALRLYVAMTRARDELILVYDSEPSEFLKVMADCLFEKLLEFEDPKHSVSQEIVSADSFPTNIDRDGIQAIPTITDNLDEDHSTGSDDKVERRVPSSDLKLEPISVSPVEIPTSEEPAFDTQSINGITVVRIPRWPTQGELAKRLGRSEFEIYTKLHQNENIILQGEKRVPEGYVKRICQLYGCVPRFVETKHPKKASNGHADDVKIKNFKRRNVVQEITRTEVSFASYRREFCSAEGCEVPAMHGSSYCYQHDTK